MEPTPRKFESTLLDEEAIREDQRKRSEEPIDRFDVDSLEENVEFYKRNGFVPDDKRLEYMKNTIGNAYDSFLGIGNIFSPRRTFAFWNILYNSKDQYFSAIRAEAEARREEQDGGFALVKRRVVDALVDRSLPIESWIFVLKEYKKMLEGYNQYVQEIAPEMRRFVAQKFIERINPQIEKPRNEEDLMSILNAVNFQIRDPLISVGTIGSYTGADKTIDLDLSIILDMAKEGGVSKKTLNVISHESLHAITSGKVLRHEKTLTFNEGPNWKEGVTRPQWSGLEVSGYRTDRFEWLNEAITETLSSYMVEIEPVEYPQERKLVDLLLVKGRKKIDKKLLINAYFEKKGYEADEKEGQKFWNQFRREIQESYDHDKQFLVKLDILIQHKGIMAAIELLDSWKPENPQQIDIKTVEKEDKKKE